MEFVILDLETTGLSKQHHTITEIAAVKVKDGIIIDKFESLVNPGVRIPAFITQLTGIDNEMVKDAPSLDEALQRFLTFLGDAVIVAHNAQFDYGFLSHHAKTLLDHTLENRIVCTKRLAGFLLPQLKSRKLGSICSHMNIINEQAHRAMSDVKATYQIFNNFIEMLTKKGITEPERILAIGGSGLR
ncbi:MAG: PolC-type DNA polymerase III [Nanoarchaeota archaeon]